MTVTDGDISVRRLDHLVHPLGPERRPENAGDRLPGRDVRLLGIEASQPRLLLLLPDDQKWPTKLVEGQSHLNSSTSAKSIPMNQWPGMKNITPPSSLPTSVRTQKTGVSSRWKW